MYSFLNSLPSNIYSLESLEALLKADDEKTYYLSEKREELEEALISLHCVGLICFLPNSDINKSWVIKQKDVLLSKANGVLFNKTKKEELLGENISNTD